MGNIAGKVHSHRFPGANTAVPTANEDAAQLKATEDFLTSGALTVDIFALSPAQRAIESRSDRRNTNWPPPSRSEKKRKRKSRPARRGEVALRSPLPSTACSPPFAAATRCASMWSCAPRRVGHFFPGGTVDAYDTWLELKGVDDKGQTIFWSGMVEDNGKGPVEKGAHFYRSLQVDAHGNPINKRNAWATRAVVYVRLIPPGAADTVHFRMKIPEKTGSKITLTARLCYRKFAWLNTQFAFAGRARPAQSAGRLRLRPITTTARMAFTASLQRSLGERREDSRPADRRGRRKRSRRSHVCPHNAPAPQPKTQLRKEDWQRWNDYGIGLLLQGDLKAAQAASKK